jgi:hypothetical protein
MTTTIIVIFAIGAMAALVEFSSRRSIHEAAAVVANDAPIADRIAPFFERAATSLALVEDRQAPVVAPVADGPIFENTNEAAFDDVVAREAADVFVHWDLERNSIQQSHHEEIQSMIERLEKARLLVEQSGVGAAVCDILQLMWRWPAWQALKDWRPPLLIDQFTCGAAEEADHEQEIRWFRWRSGEERYRLSLALRPEPAPDRSPLGDLRLWVGNALVLHLDVTRLATDAPDDWSLSDVSALDPGHWMIEINEFAGRLLMANQRMLQDYEFSYFDEKARKIAIG